MSTVEELTTQKAYHEHCRGISNVTGVSCHLSSALQLIYHAIDQQTCKSLYRLSQILRSSPLPPLASNSVIDAASFLISFSSIIQAIDNNVGDEIISSSYIDSLSFRKKGKRRAVDPSSFYLTISPILDSTVVGDAATSFRTIFQTLHQSMEELMSSLNHNTIVSFRIDISGKIGESGIGIGKNANKHEALNNEMINSLRESILDVNTRLQDRFWGGTTLHQILASKVEIKPRQSNNSSQKKTRKTRYKPIQEKPLPCPLSLPIQKNYTLVQALESVFMKTQPIEGYSWEGVVDFIEKEEIIKDEKYVNAEKTNEKLQAKVIEGVENLTSALNLEKEDVDTAEAGSYQASYIRANNVDKNSPASFSFSSSPSSISSSSSLSSCSNATSSSFSSSLVDSVQDDDGAWKICKVTRLTYQLPRVLIFHLKRFEYRAEKVCNIFTKLDVPVELDLTPFLQQKEAKCKPSVNDSKFSTDNRPTRENGNVDSETCPYCNRFKLQGAIVHVDNFDRNKGNCNHTEEFENGHYMTYVLKKNQSTEMCEHGGQVIWIKIDDEQVSPYYVVTDKRNKSTGQSTENTADKSYDDNLRLNSDMYPTIPQKAFLQMLGGERKKSTASHNDRCATLLMYVTQCKCEVGDKN